MTPEQMQREERHAALMAVACALTGEEQAQFTSYVSARWPRLRGAQVADVLDMAVDYDMFLDRTEPFYEKFHDQLPDAGYAISFAVRALAILDRPLTPGSVISLLQRAGVTAPPRYPDVRVGLWADARTPFTDANHLMLLAKAEQGMRAGGVTEGELTEFRASVRATDVPGFSRNVADIAAWVTLTEEHTALPGKAYDPAHDLAVAVLHADFYESDGGEVAASLANLRAHMDLSSVEAVEAQLEDLFGKRA